MTFHSKADISMHIDSLVWQDCSNSNTLAIELLQSCTKPPIKFSKFYLLMSTLSTNCIFSSRFPTDTRLATAFLLVPGSVSSDDVRVRDVSECVERSISATVPSGECLCISRSSWLDGFSDTALEDERTAADLWRFLPPGVSTASSFTCKCERNIYTRRLSDTDNPLGPSDTIWQHRSGSTLAQVMACCLMAPSHYLNQCWLMMSEIWWHSPEGNFTGNAQDICLWYEFENY